MKEIQAIFLDRDGTIGGEDELLNFGFKDTFICPHTPEMFCNCRKPKEGMLLMAKEKYNLDLEKSVIIGDRYTDMLAAQKVGAIKILVLTGCGEDSLKSNLWNSSICDYIAKDLLDAVNWIKNYVSL